MPDATPDLAQAPHAAQADTQSAAAVLGPLVVPNATASLPQAFYAALVRGLRDQHPEVVPRHLHPLLSSLVATSRSLRDLVAQSFTICHKLPLPPPNASQELVRREAQRLYNTCKVFRKVWLYISQQPADILQPYGDFRAVIAAAATLTPPAALDTVQVVVFEGILMGPQCPMKSLVPSWLQRLCPAVTSVRYASCAFKVPDKQPCFGPAMCFPTVTNMTLQLVLPVPAAQLQQQLAAMPHLTHLTLTSMHDGCNLMQPWPFLASGVVHLPQVTHLQVDCGTPPPMMLAHHNALLGFPHLPQQFPNLKWLKVNILTAAAFRTMDSWFLPSLQTVQCTQLMLFEDCTHTRFPCQALFASNPLIASLARLPLDDVPALYLYRPGAMDLPTFAPSVGTCEDPAATARVLAAIKRWSAAGCFDHVTRLTLSPSGTAKWSVPLQYQGLWSAWAWLDHLPALKHLILFCWRVSPAFLKQVCEKLPTKVETLGLSSCEDMEQAGGTQVLVENLPQHVKRLHFEWEGSGILTEAQLLQLCMWVRRQLSVEVEEQHYPEEVLERVREKLREAGQNVVTLRHFSRPDTYNGC